MDAGEKEELLGSLRSGQSALLETLAGVTEEAAARLPGPGKWSILQCVEHLAATESILFERVQAATHAGEPVVNTRREALIQARGADRRRPIQAPEAAVPAGRFSTLADAIREFVAHRRRTIDFVENATGDLRCDLTTHPIIGQVNCYEMLLMMAMHPQRHAKQIQEILAELH